MTTDTRIISHKLSLLKLAQSINNISKACRDSFVSRTSFYEYKARFETYGINGLEDKPRKAPKMPNETRKDIVEMVLDVSRRYPSYGASRIACELGNIVCGTTVHNILKKRNLSKKFDRLLAMVDIPEDVKLSPVMLRKLEMASNKKIEVSRAGELISVDTFYVGCLKGIGRLYQITAIDCYSSFGLAHLYTEKSAKDAADFIFRVSDMFLDLSIKIENVLTDNGKEFTSHWGSTNHIFEVCLKEKNITHRYTKVSIPGQMTMLNGSSIHCLLSSTIRHFLKRLTLPWVSFKLILISIYTFTIFKERIRDTGLKVKNLLCYCIIHNIGWRFAPIIFKIILVLITWRK